MRRPNQFASPSFYFQNEEYGNHNNQQEEIVDSRPTRKRHLNQKQPITRDQGKKTFDAFAWMKPNAGLDFATIEAQESKMGNRHPSICVKTAYRPVSAMDDKS